MRYLLSVALAVGLGAVVGAVLGLAIQQFSGQAGWALVVGSLGANCGALWAALRRADDEPAWRLGWRRRSPNQGATSPRTDPTAS